MKKQVTIEQSFCDICEKNISHNHCLSCGKNICYDCQKVEAKVYRYSVSVYCSGSGDGFYCRECDTKLIVNGDKLHKAYRAIESLRNEEAAFYANFKARTDQAESALKNIRWYRQEE